MIGGSASNAARHEFDHPLGQSPQKIEIGCIPEDMGSLKHVFVPHVA